MGSRARATGVEQVLLDSRTIGQPLRNRALIALMYRAGLRVSEALALQPKDVDLAAGTLRVLHGKGDRDAAKAHLSRALEAKADFPGREEARNLLARNGG